MLGETSKHAITLPVLYFDLVPLKRITNYVSEWTTYRQVEEQLLQTYLSQLYVHCINIFRLVKLQCLIQVSRILPKQHCKSESYGNNSNCFTLSI